MSTSPVTTQKKSARVRRETRRFIESYDRVAAAANGNKSSVNKSTRSIPNEKGFDVLTSNEAKRDVREASKTKSAAVFTSEFERGDKDLYSVQTSLRPSCAPESVLMKKFARIMNWLQAPYSISEDLAMWQAKVHASKEAYQHQLQEEDAWLAGFQLARKHLVEASKTVQSANSSLRETAEQLLQLCEEQRFSGSGSRKRRGLDLDPLTFDNMKDLAEVFQERHAALLAKVRETIQLAEGIEAEKAEAAAAAAAAPAEKQPTKATKSKKGEPSHGVKDITVESKPQEQSSRTAVAAAYAVTVDELYYPEDTVLHSRAAKQDLIPVRQEEQGAGAGGAVSTGLGGRSSKKLGAAACLRALTKEEQAIEHAQRTRTESFDFYLNQLSYEGEETPRGSSGGNGGEKNSVRVHSPLMIADDGGKKIEECFPGAESGSFSSSGAKNCDTVGGRQRGSSSRDSRVRRSAGNEDEADDIKNEEDSEEESAAAKFVARAAFPQQMRDALINLTLCVQRDEAALGNVDDYFRKYVASSSSAESAAVELQMKDRQVVGDILRKKCEHDEKQLALLNRHRLSRAVALPHVLSSQQLLLRQSAPVSPRSHVSGALLSPSAPGDAAAGAAAAAAAVKDEGAFTASVDGSAAVSSAVAAASGHILNPDSPLDTYLALRTETEWLQFVRARYGAEVGGVYRAEEPDIVAACKEQARESNSLLDAPDGVLSSVLSRNKRRRTAGGTLGDTDSAEDARDRMSASPAGGSVPPITVHLAAGLRQHTLYSNQQDLYISALSQHEDRVLGSLHLIGTSASGSAGAADWAEASNGSSARLSDGLPTPSSTQVAATVVPLSAHSTAFRQLREKENDVLERCYLQSRAAGLDLHIRHLRQRLVEHNQLLAESNVALDKSQRMFDLVSVDGLLEQDKICKDLMLYGLTGGAGADVSEETIRKAVEVSRKNLQIFSSNTAPGLATMGADGMAAVAAGVVSTTGAAGATATVASNSSNAAGNKRAAAVANTRRPRSSSRDLSAPPSSSSSAATSAVDDAVSAAASPSIGTDDKSDSADEADGPTSSTAGGTTATATTTSSSSSSSSNGSSRPKRGAAEMADGADNYNSAGEEAVGIAGSRARRGSGRSAATAAPSFAAPTASSSRRARR